MEGNGDDDDDDDDDDEKREKGKIYGNNLPIKEEVKELPQTRADPMERKEEEGGNTEAL